MSTGRTLCVLLLLLGIDRSAQGAEGRLFRVGPGRDHARLSEVAEVLKPGDTVEIAGDVADSFVIDSSGTLGAPISIIGVVEVTDGVARRPVLTLTPDRSNFIGICRGDNIVIEGLDFSGVTTTKREPCTGLHHAGDNLLIRNCVFHHFDRKAIQGSSIAGDITLEFCEFYCNGSDVKMHTVDLFSRKLGGTVTVQHCYFHDAGGGTLLKSHAPRNIFRYNWFESPYYSTIAVVDLLSDDIEQRKMLDSNLYPMHTDILGNVFLHGSSPGSKYAILSLGAEHQTAPGTEGDFHIAHNLFISARSGVVSGVAVMVYGNVDNVHFYNNVFLELGPLKSKVFERGVAWPASPRTTAFVRRRGHGEPVLHGSGNWISSTAADIPREFRDTIRGVNPGFVDLVNGDYRPCLESPLVAAGSISLPRGRLAKLEPEFEPRRYIPVDLTPKARRKAEVPSIGPFEACAVPATTGDASGLLLTSGDPKRRFPWPFAGYVSLQEARAFAAKENYAKALAAAKSCFILCDLEQNSLETAIQTVRSLLSSIDGNDQRADAFEEFARRGPGESRRDPLVDVVAEPPLPKLQDYTRTDQELERRKALVAASAYANSDIRWYETQKAVERINRFDFDSAGRILSAVLAEMVWAEAGDVDGRGEAQRNQDVLDRAEAGLSVVYRARRGTLNGLKEFLAACKAYAKYGASGRDGECGTTDDLVPPM